MPWYAQGEIADYVLSVIESTIDGTFSDQQFINKLYTIGMSDLEIMNLFHDEVLGRSKDVY